MVKFLIAHGADVNATDENGRTALMHTADMDRRFGGSGHLQVVQILLAAGARPELRDRLEKDARSLAEAQRKTTIAQILQRALTSSR